MGVLELSGINEMIEVRKRFNIGLIREAANPLARLVRQAVNAMAVLFL